MSVFLEKFSVSQSKILMMENYFPESGRPILQNFPGQQLNRGAPEECFSMIHRGSQNHSKHLSKSFCSINWRLSPVKYCSKVFHSRWFQGSWLRLYDPFFSTYFKAFKRFSANVFSTFWEIYCFIENYIMKLFNWSRVIWRVKTVFKRLTQSPSYKDSRKF